ncbi:alpha/beta hydrolase-fold protein [Alteromonas stellipolaris]|uniref:Esterase n=1 Tax=Alteromonas stellipolaris TaxID=233316 RepID=A0ABN4LIU5_9ALTE|nr:alpha/beta hydrolase-fold protein [Alteromonas stellipolaris]ALM90869.1 Beta-lactamase class C and other penicillin binding protein [Alteromonas stellipolaris LMG 21856]AMJ73914.1 esterase [Alteromonas stellipolaris]
MLKHAITIAVFLLILVPSYSYSKVRGEATHLSIHSEILDEERELFIHLPNSYYLSNSHSTSKPLSTTREQLESQLHYPVLYLLDGQRNFAHAVGTLDLLNQSNMAQEMIVVAIANTHRSRDFTPTYDANYNEWGRSGGADNFLDFIEKELVPYINKNYRANNFKIISGHSLGGLLSVYALQSRPHLFQAHFAFSPSLWWQEQVIFDDAETFFSDTSELNNYLYINMGSEGGHMLTSYQRYIELLNTHKRKGFNYNTDLDTSEGHNTTALAGHSLAYQNLYKSLQPSNEVLSGGIPAIKQFYKAQSEMYGYDIKPSYRAINSVGYKALSEKDYSTAIAIFQSNVESYPYKADAYDSLADGFEASGDLQKALEMRSLAIQKSVVENVENGAYKTRHANLLTKIQDKNL